MIIQSSQKQRGAGIGSSNLKIGTRRSQLALAQAELVVRALSESNRGLKVELVPIITTGDRDSEGEDKSRFVKEIEQALLDEEVDLAVHSAKDLPGEEVDGLKIAAVPKRNDARDMYLGQAESIEDIGRESCIGTSSLRRKAQLKAVRPDVETRELHGNIDTRLRRLEQGDFDGIVLAAAGLARLQINDVTGFAFELEELVPAPGQGSLAVQTRASDSDVSAVVEKINDPVSHSCLLAERTVVRELGATCSTPLGVHARIQENRLTISAFIGTADGSKWIRDQVTSDANEPISLGESFSERLVSAGAKKILSDEVKAHR